MDLDARSTCWKKVNPIGTTCNCQFHNLFTAKMTTMVLQMKIIAGSRQYKTVIKSCLCMHQLCPRKRTILGRPKLLFFVRCFDLFVAVADVIVAVVVRPFVFHYWSTMDSEKKREKNEPFRAKQEILPRMGVEEWKRVSVIQRFSNKNWKLQPRTRF